MKILFIVSAILLLFSAGIESLSAQSGLVNTDVVQPKPVNLDFEDGEAGKMPDGWVSPTNARGFQAELTEISPKTGRRAGLLKSLRGATEADERAFGNLMQAIDAAPYRGKRVRLRAAVKLEPQQRGARSFLWMRADRPNKQRGFFDNMSDRPILFTSGWQFFEIVGDIEEDATVINFGMLLMGRGAAYLDSVTLEDLGKPIILNEPPRALTTQGLENLVAFARLLGYVRHFHPSDEAAAVDWEAFAVGGIRQIESAKNKKELVEGLEKLFRPIAPTARVYLTGKRTASAKDLKPNQTGGLKIISWHHNGFGQKNAGPAAYSSERKTRETTAEETSASSLDPRRPFTADLGGGVSVSVPLALFADDKGTLPRANVKQDNGAENKPAYKFSGNDRLTRLTSVVLAWNVFQHFYPYFDVVQTDWQQVLKDSLTSAAADKDEKEFLQTMRRMVAQLHDGHGNVTHPSGRFTYELPILFDWAENNLVVSQTAAANTEGLQPGDIILSVDGKPSAEVLAEIETFISGATGQWRRQAALRSLRMGIKDSEVRLEVENEAGQKRFVTLRRSNEAFTLRETRPAKIEEIKPSVFYVDLDRISDDDFIAALPKLEKAKGIVFDLRGYPKVSPQVIAHLIDKPVQSAQWLIPIVKNPDHQNMTDYDRRGRWDLQPEQPRLTAKIAFITDGRAISYAESYMGIIEAYKLAEIVGEPTAGTNGNINPFTVPGGYRVVWTGMRVIKHDNSQHHGIGIKPTVPVSKTIRGIRENRDEQLEKAVEIVSAANKK